MLNYTDIELKELWLATYKRKGQTTENSGPFDELNNEIQKNILQKIKLFNEEILIIVSFKNNSTFTALTSKRIISIIDDKCEEVFNSVLIKEEYDDWRKMKMKGWQVMKINYGEKSLVFTFEGGGPLVGMINVIKNIIVRNE